MQKIGFAEALDSIVATDVRYGRDAYVFLRDALDYTACHALADAARASQPPVQAIRYESARREGGACEAVFDVRALATPRRAAQQTWICKVTRERVL